MGICFAKNRSTSEQGRRSKTIQERQWSYALNDEKRTPDDGQTRGQEQDRIHEFVEKEAEDRKERSPEYDNPKHLPNLASHLEALTTALLKRTTDSETSDKMYDEFVRAAKLGLLYDLDETYNELHDFYDNPSAPTPTCFSKSRPGKEFFTSCMDIRLGSRSNEIRQCLVAFLDEQGFVNPEVTYIDAPNFAPFFHVNVLLDVAKVPTRES